MNTATADVLMEPTAKIEFFAAGLPGTKGSMRPMTVGKGGPKERVVLMNMSGQKAKTWHAVVNGAAFDAMARRAPLDGPLHVEVTFFLPRPKAHFTKKGLRPDAPTAVSKTPDIDKLARCALDALTGVVFVDDARIASLVLRKRYANGATGAAFVVEGLVA